MKFFLYVTNAKAYQRKTEKSSLAMKNSFIGSATGHLAAMRGLL